jgi:hypothetical protein
VGTVMVDNLRPVAHKQSLGLDRPGFSLRQAAVR